jgi:hypothetical protein
MEEDPLTKGKFFVDETKNNEFSHSDKPSNPHLDEVEEAMEDNDDADILDNYLAYDLSEFQGMIG